MSSKKTAELFPANQMEGVAKPPLRPPPDDNEKELHQVMVRYEAPLPPPAHLEYYERIKEGAADRIIQMAEGSISHAQKYNYLLLIFAFLIVLIVLISAIILVLKGEGLFGFILILTKLSILLIAFKTKSKYSE